PTPGWSGRDRRGPRGTAAPAPSARSAHSAPSAHSAASPSPATGASRGRGRSLGRPAVEPEAPLAPPRAQEEEPGGGRVVQAADRFRELVAGRPWRRRRRAIIAGTLVTLLVLVAALATAVMLPTLQVRDITVEGTGYVAEEDVREAVASHTGDSVLLLHTHDIADRAAEVPGVASAEVDRSWPDGMTVTVTEAAPVAQLTRADGSTAVVDAAGEELPAAAGEGATLVPMTVQGGAADPEGAAATMSEVLATLPDPLRGAVREVSASSTSDVTLVLSLEDGGTKTVVWGDAHDADLKAEVVQALLGRPGTTIDVSSPVAPVTR
ncbi:cell division protein FtsQ/DivIB, partial [Brachybacterium atlanticum]|uniref:cell division protein FtsQ/DivIB n=1 Tax=Brachybacterium atlanticum TaxID=2911888 RepID=UPI0021E0E415